VLKRFGLARAVREADAVVSLAKLKTHGQALYTGAVKNMLGCVPGGGKIRVHQFAPKSRQLAAALVDIFAVVRPRFALIDGIVAMQGNGPNLGDPRPLGLLIASRDAVAADAVAARIIGYPPRTIHVLHNAEERGLGTGSLDRIEVVGEALDDCLCPDFVRASNLFYELIPAPLARLIGGAVRVDPEIVQAECKRCGLCQRSCPADAIEGEETFRVDTARCIRCFCCHELCPHGAVVLRRSLLVRLYDWFTRKRSYTD
jgi:ferredoxin